MLGKIQSLLNSVLDFHRRFQATISDHPTTDIPAETKRSRKALIKEETQELLAALDQGSLPQIAKESADVLYVVLGTVVAYGLHGSFDKVFQAVHSSNMSKANPDGTFKLTPDRTKVAKNSHYKKPDIASIIAEPRKGQL